MQRVDLSRVPTDQLDSKGLTAFEVLQSREDLSGEITRAFERLVRSQALVPEPRPQDSSTTISKPSETEMTSTSGSNDDPSAEEVQDVVSDQHSKQRRNTGSGLKRAAWVENAGKLVRGTATDIKLQRDLLCVVLLAYVIALFCRSLWCVSL